MNNELKMYHKGVEDGWKLAQKVNEMTPNEAAVVFEGRCIADVIASLTAAEVNEKLETYEYEKQSKEPTIDVGYVLKLKNSECRVIALEKPSGKYVRVLDWTGVTRTIDISEWYEWTGEIKTEFKNLMEELNEYHQTEEQKREEEWNQITKELEKKAMTGYERNKKYREKHPNKHRDEQRLYRERHKKPKVRGKDKNGYGRWTQEEIEMVLRREMPDKKLAYILGRSVSAIRACRAAHKERTKE